MRIALSIEYNGHGFYGWQKQKELPTIQGTLENALSNIANEPIYIYCAGRTDAKVHATAQVVHFDTNAKRHIDAWIWGTNSHLPPSISVRFAKQMDYHFHARFSAISRRYRYVIYNHPIRSAILHTKTSWCFCPLDETKMQKAAAFLLGEHNFSSFRSAQCQSKSPNRFISDVSIKRQGDFVIFEIEANAFLHHMVRNIAAVLMKIGSGNKNLEWIQEVISAQSRLAAAETASPNGLYLTKVTYKEPYQFPLNDRFFLI